MPEMIKPPYAAPIPVDTREPRFEWGQRVTAAMDLINDGSYPDEAEEALLVETGCEGEIVQVGMHLESNTPVYMVEFKAADGPSRVVGCLEEEISLI